MFDSSKVDLGSLSQVSEDEDLDNDNLEFTVSEAVKVNPDNHAKVLDLSEKTGVPSFAVNSDIEQAEQDVKKSEFDFTGLQKRSPKTALYFNDIDNAIVAQDDVDVLESIEGVLTPVADVVRSFPAGFVGGFGGVSEGLGRTIEATRGITARTLDVPVSSFDPLMGLRLPDIETGNIGLDKISELIMAPAKMAFAPAAELREIGGELKETAETIGAPHERRNIATDISGALGQMTQQIATAIANPIASGVSLFAQGVDQQGERQEQTNTEGESLTSDLALLGGGVITAVTEKVGLDKLLNRVPPKIKNDILRKITDITMAGGMEAIQEVVEGISQSVLELYTTNPDAEIFEGIENEAIVAGGAGTIARAVIMTAIPGRNRSVQTEAEIKEMKGEVEQQKIDQLNEDSQKSKLRERDKESFRQFVNDADDSNTHVFIDGAQTALYLQDKTPEEIEADPALKLLAEQAREAAELGTDLNIPVADFAADIAGTEHYDELRDSMTMSEESTTPFRQEQVDKETETYIKTLMDEAQENASEYVEAQEIYDTVRDQLIDTGQVTPANASIMAQIVPAWATAQARRQGKTVQEIYQDSGLTVEGPLTGERARLEGEIVLEQDVADDFSTIEGVESKIQSFKTLDEAMDFFRNPETSIDSEVSTAFFDKYSDEGSLSPEKTMQKAIDELAAKPKLEQRAIIPTEVTENEQARKRREEADQETATEAIATQQETINRAKERTDTEALAEFNRAKSGEQVTFTHRSDVEFDQFDDSLLGQNTTTPSANLGHYLSADDVGNVERYGTDLSVHQFTLKKPLIIGAEVFADVMGDLTIEEVAERREALMELGHDGILIEGLNWAIAFEGSTVTKLEEELELFEQKGKDKSKARGYYEPANSVIRLNESSDLSTFLHEFAHFMYEMEATGDTDLNQSINNWYKRNAKDVAKEAMTYVNGDFDILKQGERTSDKPIKITSDDVTTFLDDNTTGNKDKDSAIRRAVHEQFARGFETYLMEGKSPSIELRNAFRAFARWLSRIYQNLRVQLDVNLDNEMRQVFGRLIATEEQIQAAEGRARIEPMFTDAAMAGMTEQEFADYQERQEKVKDVQSETLRDKMIKQLTRQSKKWWKEEKQDLIDEETESLVKEKVYAARARLRDGDIKLDHASIKADYGTTKKDKLDRTIRIVPPAVRGMTAKGMAGIHPDEAAGLLGYDSGSELVNDLINAPKIKDQATENAEAKMIERHGDIFTDGTIEKEADEAVRNEERGKLILHELKIISRGTNTPAVERNTVKALADERIGKLAFRQIHPGKYRKAEIRAAQEATAMLAEGNRQGAASAKMRQVMNYYLGMSATNAKNDTMTIVDRMTRYNKKKVRENIQKVEGGYWDQIAKILNRFEFRKSATLKGVESINTWMKERTEAEGDGLVLSNPVLNESYVTHWKNVPFSDLQGVDDSVKNIEHVARYADKLTRMQEEIDFNKLVDRWVTSMDDKVKSRFKPVASIADKPGKAAQWGRWSMAQMTKIPFMASWLDGGERVGISHDIMVQPFTDAYNAELALWEESGKPVMDLIMNRSKEDLKRHNSKIFIPEIEGTAGHTGNLMGHEVIAVALNTGNQSNLRKMLLGEGWANPDVDAEITFNNPKLQAVLAHMTKSDWNMVQKIWDQMETLYPKLAEVHRRTTGLVPPKVESSPVETEFGTFKGGYYPVKYDPARDHRTAQNEEKLNAETDSMFSNNASIQASVNTGATNERTGYYAPMRLSLDVVSAHFQETIHYITHHDPVREVNRLIRNKQVSQTIKDKLGPEEYAQLRPWLNDIAKDGREAPTKMFWDSMLGRLRFGVTLGVMGFKASTGIIQLSGLSNSMAEVGVGPMYQSLRSILKSPSTIKDAWEFASENSKVLKHRTKTMDREIKNAMKRIEGKRGVLAAAQEASMKHIAYIQTFMVDLPTWHASYIKNMNEHGDETRAYRYADWVIENIQGSGATKDMARIMRSQAESGRMFTMFMTFFSSMWNTERDLVKGARSGRYSKSTVAAKAMFLFTIPVLFEMMMRGELGEPEDDDDRLQRMLTNTAMYPFQSIPFVRDIVNATGGSFGYNISPIASVIEQGTKSIPKLVSGGFTDDEITLGSVKGTTKFAGALIGLPGVNQAWATGEHLYDVIEEGEDLTMHQLLFGPERE